MLSSRANQALGRPRSPENPNTIWSTKSGTNIRGVSLGFILLAEGKGMDVNMDLLPFHAPTNSPILSLAYLSRSGIVRIKHTDPLDNILLFPACR